MEVKKMKSSRTIINAAILACVIVFGLLPTRAQAAGCNGVIFSLMVFDAGEVEVKEAASNANANYWFKLSTQLDADITQRMFSLAGGSVPRRTPSPIGLREVAPADRGETAA